MFTKKLINWFTQPAKQSELEVYINSKQPTNHAEVEQLTRQFQDQQYIWARGL
jgi:hypothetical protein